jgi:HEPN domain-containing protein
MKELTKEWILKAEGDFKVALREYDSEDPNHDAICFHIQQCLEKYMKGILFEYDILFPRIHDLSKLLNLLIPQFPLWEVYRNQLEQINRYAVETRYPGDFAEKEDSDIAMHSCNILRNTFRESLTI